MAYIGRGIDNISQIEVLDIITFTNSAGPYNILKSSVAFTPSTPQSLLIEIDGIIQAPSSYTIAGSTITFGVSMASGSTMNSILHFGTGIITTPADLSVTTAKIVDNAITNAKVADDAIGIAELSATGTASASNYLRGDNSWASIAADTNDKVSVSANDTTPNYLNGKLVAGTNISLTEGSDGGNETLTAAFTGNLNASVINAGTVSTDRLPTITVAKGGTNLTSFTAGDVLYATGATTLAKLPKGTASQTLKMNSGATAPEWATVATPSGGLDVSDVWRVHTGVTVDSTGPYLTANWERADDVGQASLGTGMTESSGVFTFPSTGFWVINWGFHLSHGGGTQSRYAGGRGYVSTDGGSTYTQVLEAGGSIAQNYTTTWSNNFGAFGQLDVTDISQFKVKFQIYAENSGDFWGNTQKNSNWVHWAKVGAT